MTESFLHGVEVIDIDSGARPIRTARASVIGLVGTAPKGPVNIPTLIAGSRLEAVTQFGQGIGTIPDALDAIFDHCGAVVVVINVLDPDTHKEAVAAAEYTFDDDDLVTLVDQYVSNVVVKDQSETTTYVEDTDYTVNYDTGVITRLAGGSITEGETVSVSYDKPDPTAVTSTEVIGGVNETTGAYEGVHALLGAESEVHVTPRILCVPGYTHDRPGDAANPVVAELLGIADSLRAVIIADGPNTTDADAITYREDWGSERVYVVDPWVKVWDEDTEGYVDMPASARVAGIIAKTDDERGFWWSPSNQDMYGIGGSSRAVEFSLGDPNCRANLLNENEVTTIIHRDGYRIWGNRTCSSDAKWAFLNVVRIRDMLHESLLQAHLWAVDRNITKTYVEDVLEGVRSYGRSLIAKEAILGFSAWLDEDLNTNESIAAGQIYIDFDFTPAYPAERVTFRSHLVNDYISNIFD